MDTKVQTLYLIVVYLADPCLRESTDYSEGEVFSSTWECINRMTTLCVEYCCLWAGSVLLYTLKKALLVDTSGHVAIVADNVSREQNHAH